MSVSETCLFLVYYLVVYFFFSPLLSFMDLTFFNLAYFNTIKNLSLQCDIIFMTLIHICFTVLGKKVYK